MVEQQLRVVHYPRVSSLKQLKLGDSVEAQLNRFKHFSEEHDHEVVGVQVDSKSASISDDKINIDVKGGQFIVGMDFSKRPGFKWLVENASLKVFDAILFFKWDRFSRNTIFSKIAQIYFERHGIQLIPTDDSTDPLMVEIKGSLSQEEIRKMKERVWGTRKLRFDNGVMVGRPPVGYRFNDRKKLMEVDQRKAAMVRDVFAMALEGSSYKDICSKHKIKPQSYYNIIKNKVYTGVIEFEGVEKVGVHEPLITKEVFDAVQRKKAS